jgi:hypothetical protein
MQSPISLLHMYYPVWKILLVEPLMAEPKGGEQEGGLKSHVDGANISQEQVIWTIVLGI